MQKESIHMRPSWDQFYLKMADFIATRSKDMSTKVGAILVKENAVISMGYNGFPRGVNDDVDARHMRPMKYFYFEHAERNAIYNAARHGISTLNSTMYTQGVPCADCARAVIQAGIQRVVAYHQALFNLPKWGESCAIGWEMLKEAGVGVVVTGDPEGLRSLRGPGAGQRRT
jgi:dCMP deaminase